MEGVFGNGVKATPLVIIIVVVVVVDVVDVVVLSCIVGCVSLTHLKSCVPDAGQAGQDCGSIQASQIFI